MASEHYDLIVIGGGAAGLTASAYGGEMGKKTALIERERLGGDCTWYGCMPSKALLKAARVAHAARTASRFGVHTSAPTIDLTAVRARMQQAIDDIYQHETPEAFSRHGVKTLIGEARFVDPQTVLVGGHHLTAKKYVIATGARPTVPPIPGLDSAPYHTNLTIFDNTRLPEHLLVLGAGPVGMELGQAYARFGSRVTIIGEQILPRAEPEAAAAIRAVFADEGIRLVEDRVTQVAQGEGICLTLASGEVLAGDMLLLAVGRTPEIEGLHLDKAGVHSTPEGIPVSPTMQTNVPHIYAVGDVTTRPKFTHYAGLQAEIAGWNLLLPLGKRRDKGATPPWVTYTDPEIAHVGLTEAEARERYGRSVGTFTLPMFHGDRAVVEGDTSGFVKLVYKGNRLLGATVVAARAGEMIIEYTLAVEGKISVSKLVGTMHAYPTYSDIAKKALSEWQIDALLGSRTGRLLRAVVSRLP